MADQVAVLETKSWMVPLAINSVRLDAFVRLCLPHLSRREIDKAIGAKLFLVDGRVGKKGERLVAGNVLIFTGPLDWLADLPRPAADLDIPIIYEDDAILALNKPAGMATHGFSARDRTTLANFLAARRPELLHVGKSRWEPGLVHRLDIETSGLLLVAQNRTAFDCLRAQFRRREIVKTYWALVWGDADAEGTIDFSLAHDTRDKRRMRVIRQTRGEGRERLWRALTRYRKLGAVKGLSWLEIDMATGVTHQIRAHLAAIGHPIVGDRLYGPERQDRFGLQRHFLHAKGLEFAHPDDERWIKLDAKLPNELSEALKCVGIDF